MRNIFIKGQSLFEVMFAVGIAALVMIAIVSLSTRSVKNSDFSKNNALATKYAQEGIEIVRQRRDSMGWDGFNTAYIDRGDNELPTTDSSVFTRTFRVNADADGVVVVTVTVRWTDSSGEHQVQNSTKLSNWRS